MLASLLGKPPKTLISASATAHKLSFLAFNQLKITLYTHIPSGSGTQEVEHPTTLRAQNGDAKLRLRDDVHPQ